MLTFKRMFCFLSIALFSISLNSFASDSSEVLKLRTEWAKAKFQTPHSQQIPVFEALISEAEKAHQSAPQDPEIMLWYGTILSTYASIKGGVGVLPHLKTARTMLEQSIHMNGHLENGFAYGVLGTLYARVPGWPLAFGSKDKARTHLLMAIKLSPQGSDSNYYYGDFLITQGQYAEAKKHLEIAQNAPIRMGYEIQDRGRKGEIAASMTKLRQLGH